MSLTDRQHDLLRLYLSEPAMRRAPDCEICARLGMNPRRPGALSRVHNVLTRKGLIEWRDSVPFLTAEGRRAAA